MKRYLLTFLFLLTVIVSFGQIRYVKGYFIDENNNRTECLIRNEDWANNPKEFKYKLEDSENVLKGRLESVKEFSLYGFSKYIKAKVKIDRSSNDINTLTSDSNPNWSEELLFLKILVEGKASLYIYNESNFTRFFYSVGDTLSQLICKKYMLDKYAIRQNEYFKQQLLSDLKMNDSSPDITQNLNYTRSDLEKYFVKFNEQYGYTNSKFQIRNISSNKIHRNIFNLKISSGLNSASMSLFTNLEEINEVNFKNNITYFLGVEAEFVLPFHMNKWSIVLEPTFQYYNSKKDEYVSSSANIKSVEFPVGIRYYSYLNDRTKLFFNGFFIPNFSINFNSTVIYNHNNFILNPRNSFAIGGGIEFKKFSAELRYYTRREFSDYQNFLIGYKRMSFILGYKLVNMNKKN